MSKPRLTGCSSLDLYEVKAKLGEGTFGQVFRGTFKATNTAVALKEIILHEHDHGMPITALREIKIMKALKHPNILSLLDMAVSKNKTSDNSFKPSSFYMVMRYMDHDLCGLLHNESIRFTLPHIKLYMQQLIEGVAFMHEQRYMHRDMKSANILVDNHGRIKLADFGLARNYYEAPPEIGGATPSLHKYTPKVVTRWYRAPELLLGDQYYTTAIDMWGVGCVFGEFFKRKVLLRGSTDYDQLIQIFKLLGSPTPETMPKFDELPGSRQLIPLTIQPSRLDEVFNNVPEDARELLRELLALNPLKRLTAKGALRSKFFTSGPAAAEVGALPEFPSSRELDVRRKRENPSPLPPAPPAKRNRLRAFAPRLPHKRDLRPHEQIPPYKRLERRRSKAPEPIMGKVLDY